ncbi:MAG: DEAD/DEAH box helicase [Opitutales bacterium]|nr:DEAD/DEAH box helicase [Opitutales bacterium]
MQKKSFVELGLSPELLKAIDKIGFEVAAPIQSETIPLLLAGRDVVGQSQTGSGKTAAFAAPAIQLADTTRAETQVLILCPTRELAVQVAEEVARLAAFKPGLRELPVYGGQSYDRQFRALRQGAHIVIGTPGRVIDHLDRGTLRLDGLRMLILDEADRMLDMGFLDDIRSILDRAPAERQTAFFSATFPAPIQKLVREFTRDAAEVRVKSATLDVPAIEQVYYEVHRRSKLEVLCRLIDLQDIKYAIIFCATKLMVDELTDHLIARGYPADKLHGDIPQATRERVMAKFRTRGFEFLVATDVAARGLDVDEIEVVFNYDLPHDGEDYVHRIGRTGRAGRAGRAITFVAGREIHRLQHIMRYTKGRIRREKVPSLEEVEEKRANVFFEALRETLEKGDFKRHDGLVDRLLDQGHTPTDIASALIDLLSGERPRGAEAPADGARERNIREDSRQTDTRDASSKRSKRPPRDDADPAPVARERGMVRLAFDIGGGHGIAPGDIVGVIAGAARVPRESIGAIHILPALSFVDIADAAVSTVLDRLNGINFKGHELGVSVAAEQAPAPRPRKTAKGKPGAKPPKKKKKKKPTRA